AFETAEREPDPEKIRAWLTFVIVGGGPTGVELAGALGEIAKDTLRRDFPHNKPSESRIFLVEGAHPAPPVYSPTLSEAARKSLERLGVTVRTSSMVTDVAAGSVTVKKNGETETIHAHTILWAAGVASSPLGRIISKETGATLDKAGRVTVEADLTVP